MSVIDELTTMLKDSGASLVGFSDISCVPVCHRSAAGAMATQ